MTCFWHGDEPELPGDYWLCGECWHIWRTADEFARDVIKVYAPDAAPDPIAPLETVWACPLCCHDF